MDYGRRELADRLAAQYVLGTLRGPARRRFESLLPAHAALRAAVQSWQQRLLPLAESVPAVQPPAHVWPRIEAQLFGSAVARPAATGWWHRLALWRFTSAAAGLAALALLMLLQLPAPPPRVVVLAALPEAGQEPNASFVASVSGDGRSLVLRPLQPLSLAAGRTLQLWAMPPQGAPHSLGLLSASGATTLQPAQRLRDAAALAVSVEPAGGSPTGAPSGPIVSAGRLGP